MQLYNVPLDYDDKTDTYHGQLSDLNLGGNTHPLTVEVGNEEGLFHFKYTQEATGEGDFKVDQAYVYKNDYGVTVKLYYNLSERLSNYL